MIDHLTIKNKKLRRKLKRYETLHCSHLQKEKLFEVRVHGLPAHRKRELEQTLRLFASSLEETPDTPSFSANQPPVSLLPDPLPSLHKTSSSSTSYSKPVDSAYASISASGQTMNSQSNRHEIKGSERVVQSADSKRQHVKSYLHDIPKGLLPKRSPFMTEKAKQKLVVRRLEQLFTGKGAATKGYNLSLQQQEVSKSAAKADRRASEAGGRLVVTEGVREARILPLNAEFHADPATDEPIIFQPRESTEGGSLPSGGGTPDQRPTRPLDLDLSREQIPAENIQYIRHLGIASPMGNAGASPESLGGWVYLNLLMNMAQLHTLNVTLAFVRKSVADVSARLVLSADGRKIRWRGGIEGTKMSSDSDSSTEHGKRLTLDHGYPPAQRHQLEPISVSKPGTDVQSTTNDFSQVSLYNSSADVGAGAKCRPIFLGRFNNASNFHYKPLFYRGSRSEDEGDYGVRDDGSATSSDGADSMNRAESSYQDTQGKEARLGWHGYERESGPIIFYKKALFCTDLSGDPGRASTDDKTYARFTDKPLGRPLYDASTDFSVNGGRRPLLNSHILSESVKAGGDSPATSEPYLTIEASDLVHRDEVHDGVAPAYMEVSGLGNVQPQDNFVIHVQVQHVKRSGLSSPPAIPRVHFREPVRHTPLRKLDVLRGLHLPSADRSSPQVAAKCISAATTILPPSTLPDPSYISLPFSSDNDDEDEDYSQTSEDEVLRKCSPMSSLAEADAYQAGHGFPLASSDGSSQESSYISTSEGSDDSSIDLLAHARVLDPDTIAAQEQEFDSNVGLFLAELPAGSSAATAGGGSGFGSEKSGSSLTMEEQSRPNIKRRRTWWEKTSWDGIASSGEVERIV